MGWVIDHLLLRCSWMSGLQTWMEIINLDALRTFSSSTRLSKPPACWRGKRESLLSLHSCVSQSFIVGCIHFQRTLVTSTAGSFGETTVSCSCPHVLPHEPGRCLPPVSPFSHHCLVSLQDSSHLCRSQLSKDRLLASWGASLLMPYCRHNHGRPLRP